MANMPDIKLNTAAQQVFPVVDFNPAYDRLLAMDFTSKNTSLSEAVLKDTAAFSAYVEEELKKHSCRYGIGGYAEHRTIYSRSEHFDTAEGEPRRLHLGTDIWGSAGTPVYCPLPARVHSYQFNDRHGDYGATIILSHGAGEEHIYSLYGHLSLSSISGLSEGEEIRAGARFAEFGVPEENGHWPPHLHFQLILDLEGMRGDYPGVCRYSERERYLANCPDPQIILSHTFQ